MKKEFNLNSKRKELFEQELLGKITSAGRIYRKIIAQDKEFIKKLKEDFKDHHIKEGHIYNYCDIIDKRAGEEMSK